MCEILTYKVTSNSKGVKGKYNIILWKYSGRGSSIKWVSTIYWRSIRAWNIKSPYHYFSWMKPDKTVVTHITSSLHHTMGPVISRIILNPHSFPFPVLSQDDTAPQWVTVYFLWESLAYFVPLHLHNGLPTYFRYREMSVESSINRAQCQN